MPKWRNWQTRRIQNPVPDSTIANDADTCERPIPNLRNIHGNRMENAAPDGTESPAVSRAESDPELDAVVVAWPSLPNVIRAGILALIRATGE